LTLQALPYILLQGFLFGSTLVVSRFSVGQFEPTIYIGIRLVLASLCHVAVYSLVRNREWPRSPDLWRNAALLGLLGTAVPMVAIVSSLQFQSAGLTSLLLTAGPAVTVLMAHFFLPDETLNRTKGAGVVLALGGAVFLLALGESGLPDVSQASPLGYGLVLVAVSCGSGMTIYARKYMRDYDYFDVASVRMVTAALAVMPLSALLVGVNLSGVDARGYMALVYAALVGTFSGMMLAFYNVKRFGATASAMPLYVIPVVATLGGALLLGEQITAGMLAGVALIAAGIALINRGVASRGF
jgi:drug/metabolite transporter (DMT)-like permease